MLHWTGNEVIENNTMTSDLWQAHKFQYVQLASVQIQTLLDSLIKGLQNPLETLVNTSPVVTRGTCHNIILSLTLASDSGIFLVTTVVTVKSKTGTVSKSRLCTRTPHIIQIDWSSSTPKKWKGPSNCTCKSKNKVELSYWVHSLWCIGQVRLCLQSTYVHVSKILVEMYMLPVTQQHCKCLGITSFFHFSKLLSV